MEQTRHRRGAKSPPISLRTKGERRRRAKATPESNKSLQERGGDLHRLQLNHKRRLPQDGPAAAQLRWTTYSGGVLHLLHRKAHDIKEPCGVSTLSTRSKELSPSSSYWRTNKTRFSPNRSSGPRADFLRVPQLVLSSPSFSRPTRSPSSCYDSPTPLVTTSRTTGPTNPGRSCSPPPQMGGRTPRRARWRVSMLAEQHRTPGFE